MVTFKSWGCNIWPEVCGGIRQPVLILYNVDQADMTTVGAASYFTQVSFRIYLYLIPHADVNGKFQSVFRPVPACSNVGP